MRKYMPAIMSTLLISVIAFAASEITANFTFKVTKGVLDITRLNNSTYTLYAANPNVAGATQDITTNAAGEALTLGDVATNGVAWFRNLNTNASYYVELGVDNGGTFMPLIRLNANEAWAIRLSQGITPYARATTTGTVSSIVLEKFIFDN